MAATPENGGACSTATTVGQWSSASPVKLVDNMKKGKLCTILIDFHVKPLSYPVHQSVATYPFHATFSITSP